MAEVLPFLAPHFRLEPAENPEQLPDNGGTVVFTLKDGEKRDVVSLVLRNGRLTYVFRRNIVAGEQVYDERPIAFVSLLEGQPKHELLPPKCQSVEDLYKVGGAAMKDLPANLEWLLVFLLASDPDKAKHYTSQLPLPGKYAQCRILMDMMQAKQPLPETVRAWIGFIFRKAAGKLTIDDILLMHGSICRNALHYRTPLTNSPYGIGLFPGIAHVSTSCTPTVRPLFIDQGIVRLVATADWPAGTELSMCRGGPAQSPFVRCMQTAPQWMRHTSDAMAGVRCGCGECQATLAWLRTCANISDGNEVAPETIEKIVTIVNDTWRQDNISDGNVLKAVLTYPFRLTYMSEFTECVLQVPEPQIVALCTADPEATGPPLHVLDTLHGLLLAAIHHPAPIAKKYSGKTLELAAGCYLHGGQMALVHMLRQQGASPTLIRSRMAEHLARANFLAFAACGTNVLMARLQTKLRANADVNKLLPDVRRAMQGTDIGSMLEQAWRNTIIWCAQPTPEATSVGDVAMEAASVLVRLETKFFTALGPLVAALFSTDV